MHLRKLTAPLLLLTACWPSATPPIGQGGGGSSNEPRPEAAAVEAAAAQPGVAAKPDVPAEPADGTKPVDADAGEGVVVVEHDAGDSAHTRVAVSKAGLVAAQIAADASVAEGSWRTTAFVTVKAEPSSASADLGTIAPGSRLPRRTLAKDRGCPSGWLAVDPRGFVCGDLVADNREPDDALLPEVPRGAVIPGTYAKVRVTGTRIYDSVEAARRGQGRTSEAKLTVRRLGKVTVDGETYWRTRHGLVPADRVQQYKGSRFSGIDLDGEVSLPIAWTLRGEERFTVPLYAAPDDDAKVVRRIGPRKQVPVLAKSDDGDFVQIADDAWIDRDDVRIAEAMEAPDGLATDERWIDIDLDQQTLVAYEGSTPVYATLVSSGKVLHRTPTGIFRIERKVAERTMNSMLDASEEYTVDKVPWTAYFAHGYALHAAYWHSGFGQTRSHGCINLAPIDARRLYAWMTPALAPGWVVSYGHEDQPGSVVRVRNAKDPTPKWKGYAAALREKSQPS